MRKIKLYRKHDRIEGENLEITYEREKARICGYGINEIRFGATAEYTYWFHTLWSQDESARLLDQYAERTDQEILRKIWRELKKTITFESKLRDVERIVTKHGIKFFKTEMMRG